MPEQREQLSPRTSNEPNDIVYRILNVAVTQIRLDRARVVAVVGELVAAGMAEHVGTTVSARYP
jgi:hypothetical protein